jgi:hypothetical protein
MYVTMVDSNNDDDNNNNNKRKDMPKHKIQTAFGAYGFTRKKKMKHRNETVMAELPICSVFEGTTAADMRWQCDGYNAYFGSAQGLGSHKNSCTLLQDQLMRSVQGTGPIFAAFKNGPPGSSKDMSKQSTLMGGTVQEIPINKAASILLNNDDGMPELTKCDGRQKSNKGRAKHGKYTDEEKAELIHKWEMYHNDTRKKVSDFVKEYGLDKKFNTLAAVKRKRAMAPPRSDGEDHEGCSRWIKEEAFEGWQCDS